MMSLAGQDEARASGRQTLGLVLVFLLGVVLPRLFVLGDFPYMDEGFYIYQALSLWDSLSTSGRLLNVGGCHFYSLILSPICCLPGNLLIWMRLADLVFAFVAGVLFYRLMLQESGNRSAALCISLIGLLALNAHDAIQAGVKNSFFLAWIPLFSAVLLVGKARKLPFFLPGVLVALSVLLREPFCVYAFLGALGVAMGFGFRAALIFCAGGIVTGLIAFFCLGILRGDLHGLVDAYVNAGVVFSAESGRVLDNFLHAGIKACCDFWPLIILAILAMFFLARSEKQHLQRRLAFWLVLTLAPLPEILGKICYLYHFSMMVPCLAALSATGWRALRPHWQPRALALGMLCSIVLFFLNVSFAQIGQTFAVLKDFPRCQWSETAIARSNTLLAARKICSIKAKTLSVSGFMHFLYAATRMLPPNPRLDDLSRVYLLHGRDMKCLQKILQDNPPDVIALGRTSALDHVAMFTEELRQAINATRMYELVAQISEDPTKNYGWIGCDIYRLHRHY